MTQSILILDFGGQYCHLISRRFREIGIPSYIFPYNIDEDELRKIVKESEVRGVVLSGGPASVYEEGAPKLTPSIFSFNLPVLGICYGHQLIAKMVGGKVVKLKRREYGESEVEIVNNKVGILKGLDRKERVWMSHGDNVVELPFGFEIVAKSENSPIAAFQSIEKKIFSVQWHPEVAHSEHGTEILKNFTEICAMKIGEKSVDIVENIVEWVRRRVKKEKVLMALSGGVDSFVAATLIKMAIGRQLHVVFVDTGLLREGESKEIKERFSKLFENFHFVDASELFLNALSSVENPEEKRKIIGRIFVEVFKDIAKKIEKRYGKIRFLGQGTIFPDIVESAAAGVGTDLIKSHHNVGALPEEMEFELIEPLKEMYKDEVRELGLKLGIDESIIKRQPFPGPGLAIRIVGKVTRKRLEIVRKADRIVREEVEQEGLDKKLWQYFAVLIPKKTVGVMGDRRSYEYMVAVRIVESKDAMTAEWAKLPQDVLDRIARRIVNEIEGVNRVLYDITNKPPATIEYE